MSTKMKQCKTCGTELDKGAKICPKCGKKQGRKIKFVVVAIIVIVIICVIAGSGSDNTSKEDKNITYTSYNLSEMFDQLESNSMVAEENYEDAYVKVSGKVTVIDSDGSYISIVPDDDDFYLIGMTCYFENDKQRDVVKKKAIGDTVTVKGQIISVGEVLGYSLNIDNIE